ncbi:MAG: Hsp20/alpha crystallin family protein [Bacilli bacterium]|nr:Hsp20/alpha crystallin family protein [Bacilli bacterium]MDY5875621.1 Hsp20/alpha crystallin family protein [Bacilli bacterium]
MYVPSRFNFLDDSLLEDYRKTSIMNTDIIEKENGYELQIDLPGVKKEDIKIEMNKNLINISVSISKSSDEENKKYIRKERFTGEIKRSFNIGEDIDEDNINASFENGILYLNLPKKEENDSNKKFIEIN